jgi:formamidopyrimidine-DNA glycosylase
VRGLRRHIVGHTITAAQVAWAKTVQTESISDFIAAVIGRRIVAAERRGKYILLALDSEMHVSIHLRMTGRLFVLPSHTPPAKHTHVIWTLDDALDLHFVDQRKFGRVALLAPADVDRLNRKLGPEPLTDLTPDLLGAQVRRRSIAIKSALLDQSLVAGVGNIYADEALFAARIHPRRAANSLNDDETLHLYDALRQVLAAAVERHGTTLSDEQFKGLEGRMGENQGHLAVFRRTGQPCLCCGAPIQRLRVGGRSTHFCPSCQR